MRMLAPIIISLSMALGVAWMGKTYVETAFEAAREPFSYVR